MAVLLALLGSGRAAGYTAGLLDAAVEGAAEVSGVAVERAHLRRYRFGPCTSCFSCIRAPGSGCVLDDDMGRRGEGELYRKVLGAHALLLVDAVHLWGPTAYAHLFFERLYPTLWTGELNGMPFASISCAGNQGMQLLAREEICKWARGKGMRYVGGLAEHAVDYQAALDRARELGSKLARAALEDERGRRPFGDEVERFLAYAGEPFDLARAYLENLTGGTMDASQSLPLLGLRNGAFPDGSAAASDAHKAQGHLEAALDAYKSGDQATCLRRLAAASSAWTSATWHALLEERVVGAVQPSAYKPPVEEP
ncbi:MAG: flavodoxin family protein [Anaerolineae bacterium]|nr:flavodoxin family protein [Anaerolineae bacterium]